MYKFGRARHHGYSVMVIGLAALQFQHFRFRIEVRSNGPDHFDGTNSMRHCRHFISTNSLLARPDAPLPLHRPGGIDENSVKIEENG